MENTASQTLGSPPANPGDPPDSYNLFDFGDTISFKVTLDLPQVTVDGKSDLIFEVFGMDEAGGNAIIQKRVYC